MDIRNITIGFLFIVLTSSFSAIKIHHTGSFFRFLYTVNFMALSVKNIKPKSCKLPSPFIICTPQIYKLYKPAKNFIHIISHGMDSYCPRERFAFRCSVKYPPKNLFRRMHSPLPQTTCFFREIPDIQSKSSPQKGRLFYLPKIFLFFQSKNRTPLEVRVSDLLRFIFCFQEKLLFILAQGFQFQHGLFQHICRYLVRCYVQIILL